MYVAAFRLPAKCFSRQLLSLCRFLIYKPCCLEYSRYADVQGTSSVVAQGPSVGVGIGIGVDGGGSWTVRGSGNLFDRTLATSSWLISNCNETKIQHRQKLGEQLLGKTLWNWRYYSSNPMECNIVAH